MDKRIRRLSLSVIILFLLIAANLTYLQLIDAEKIAGRPENKRVEIRRLTIEPGEIYSSDGLLLAKPLKKGQFYSHLYPNGLLASHLIGFFSPRFGKMGLERSFESVLFPAPESTDLETFLQLPGKSKKGNKLILTIDSSLQRKAEELLGSQKGAVVALDPKTGQILALASSPSFNPNSIEQKWKEISTDSSKPLLNRAVLGLYPPGSTFKMITAAAALEYRVATVTSIFEGPPELKVDGSKVTNFKDQGFGIMSLKEAFERSCNTIFAQVGLLLGGERLSDTAERFGFNSVPPFELKVKTSRIPEPDEMDEVELAWTAVGQGRLLVTPLQMALATTAFANNGKVMRPYLVKKIVAPSGQIIKETSPEVWMRPISSETAGEVRDLMEGTVANGTGRRASVPGMRVAGKTGTAETAEKKNHAWFAGFAPVDNPRLVVVILIEEGGTGGKVAAPLARELIEAYLK